MRSPNLNAVQPCDYICDCPRENYHLLIPDYDEDVDEGEYPGGIQPGRYKWDAIVDLLRIHRGNPEAIQFIADMMDGLEEMEQVRLRLT